MKWEGLVDKNVGKTFAVYCPCCENEGVVAVQKVCGRE